MQSFPDFTWCAEYINSMSCKLATFLPKWHQPFSTPTIKLSSLSFIKSYSHSTFLLTPVVCKGEQGLRSVGRLRWLGTMPVLASHTPTMLPLPLFPIAILWAYHAMMQPTFSAHMDLVPEPPWWGGCYWLLHLEVQRNHGQKIWRRHTSYALEWTCRLKKKKKSPRLLPFPPYSRNCCSFYSSYWCRLQELISYWTRWVPDVWPADVGLARTFERGSGTLHGLNVNNKHCRTLLTELATPPVNIA